MTWLKRERKTVPSVPCINNCGQVMTYKIGKKGMPLGLPKGWMMQYVIGPMGFEAWSVRCPNCSPQA